MHLVNMHKNAQICGNMQKICKYMQGLRLVLFVQKYARNMQDICMYMQNMQARILYAVYARICIPHFADVRPTRQLSESKMLRYAR
jgi:hypothetical protein